MKPHESTTCASWSSCAKPIRIGTFGAASWKAPLSTFAREEYISNYAISKANEEATALDREEALEAADQRLTDEINFYLSRLFGGKPVLADAIEPPRSHVPLPNAQSLPFESGDETMPATKQPKRTNPATNKETDDELLAWSLGACFNNPPVSKDLRKLQEQGATDEDLLEAILVEWSTPNAGSARPYHTEAYLSWCRKPTDDFNC